MFKIIFGYYSRTKKVKDSREMNMFGSIDKDIKINVFLKQF